VYLPVYWAGRTGLQEKAFPVMESYFAEYRRKEKLQDLKIQIF
jgi:hypothetical protein